MEVYLLCNISVVTAGNIIGGGLLVGALFWYVYNIQKKKA